jgi:RimJ/RimL family protein N-acetyltransferase
MTPPLPSPSPLPLPLPLPLHELRDDRVRLRAWRDDAAAAWAAMNADPAVMEHFPGVLTRDESDAMAARIRTRIAEQGYGLWALETPELPFAGFVGLAVVPFALPQPLVARLWPAGEGAVPLHEIGWRLPRAAWGRGDASRAARLALAFARHTLRLPGVVSFTATTNGRSQAVMQRLGLSLEGEFDHPRLAPGHRLERHVLYATRWR